MRTFTDTTYYLDARERLQVVTHQGAVSVLLDSVMASNGHGFSVRFETAHLGALRQAVAHLERVQAQQAQAADETTMQQHDTANNQGGYTPEQQGAFNAVLDALLTGIEPHTDQWYAVIKQHNDAVAQR